MLKETNNHVNKRLSKASIYFSLRYISNVSDRYQTVFTILRNTAFFRLNPSDILAILSVFWEPPLSTVKLNKQIRRKHLCSLVNNVIYYIMDTDYQDLATAIEVLNKAYQLNQVDTKCYYILGALYGEYRHWYKPYDTTTSHFHSGKTS